MVLVPLGQREAEVELDGDVAELGDEEAQAEADDVAPLLVPEVLEIRREVAQVVEEGAPEELHEDGVGVLDGGQDEGVAADRVAVLVGAHAAELEAAGPVPTARVEPLEDRDVLGLPLPGAVADRVLQAQHVPELVLRGVQREVRLRLEEELVEVEASRQDLARVHLADAEPETRRRQDEAVPGVEDQRGGDREDAVRALELLDRQGRAERDLADVDLVGVEGDLEDERVDPLVEGEGHAQAALVVRLPQGVHVVEPDAEAEFVAEDVGLAELGGVALAPGRRGHPQTEELAAAGEARPADHVVEARGQVGDVEVALCEFQQARDAEAGAVARGEADRPGLALLYVHDHVPRLRVVGVKGADRQAAGLRVDQLAVLDALEGLVQVRLVVLLARQKAGAGELTANHVLARLRVALENEPAHVDLVVLLDRVDQVQLALLEVHDLVVVDVGLDVGPLAVLLPELA